MRTIHRTFAWLLVLLVLVSLLCPALAFASEDSGQELESGSEDTETTGTTNTLETGKTELPNSASQGGSDLEKLADSGLDEKKEAGSGDGKSTRSSESKTLTDGTQSGDNSTADASGEKKVQEGSLDKVAGDSTSNGSGGSLSSADGTQKQSKKSSVMELFISARGSDETGDGTHEAPFATLNAALAFAGDSDVEIILSLMTDLSLHETVPVVGNVVTVTGDDGGKKITRAKDFNAHFDPEEEHSTALFEVGTSDPESNPGGSLLIEGIVIDEAFMRTNPVQDAMIQVYDRGKLILGDDVYLLNYGGESAVHGWPGSEVVVSDSAMILDQTTVEKNGTVAVQHDEGCTYSQGAAAIVLSHGEEYEDVYGGQEEGTTNTGAGTGGQGATNTGTDTSGHGTTNTGTGTSDQGTPNTNTGDKLDTGKDASTKDDVTKDDTTKDDSTKDDSTKGDSTKDDTGDDKTNGEDSSDSPVLKIQKKAAPAGGTLTAANDGNGELKAGEESASGVSYTLTAPERVTQKSTEKTINSYTGNTIAGYEIPYTVALNLGDFLGNAGAITAEFLTGADIKLTLQLDALLYPETTAAGQNTVKIGWDYTFMTASAIYNSESAVVTISLEANEESLKKAEDLASVLSSPLSLTVNTVVPSSTDFPQKDSVTGILTLTRMEFTTRSGRPLSPSAQPEAKNAVTKLLDANKKATLVYNPNGGTGGPGTQELPAETDHPLETENVPTHEDVNGTKVLFYAWTETAKNTIYDHETKIPEDEKLKFIDLDEGEKVTVFAAYSYDRNNDGDPDAKQNLITLAFNANGGTGVPDPMMEEPSILEVWASFNIPEREPTRNEYHFVGWSEKEKPEKGDEQYRYGGQNDLKASIRIEKDKVLYAVWEENYKLYFDGNGGTNVPNYQTAPVQEGNVAELTITRQIPTRTGRTFVGWATQRYGTAAFHPGEAVKLRGGDVTLYAVWERNSSWSGSAPKTGDESNVPLYVVLAVGSAGAAYVIYRVLKKRGDKR